MSTRKVFRATAWLIACGSASTSWAQGPASDDPRIDLISPTGGEVLEAGSTCRITWAGAGCQLSPVEATVYVGLNRNGVHYAAVGSAPLSSGGMDWTLCPTLEEGDDYSLRLVVQNCRPWPEVSSERPFAIRSRWRPGITVLSPAGGEVLIAGQPVNVRWSSTDLRGGEVLVGVYASGDCLATIGRTRLEAGRLDVTLPDCLPEGSDYRIGVSWADCEPVVLGLSEAVTIKNAAAGPFRLTRPAGGEVWRAGEPQVVTWTGPGVDPSVVVTCEIRSADGRFSARVLALTTSAHRLVVWPCPWFGRQDAAFLHLTLSGCGMRLEAESDAAFAIQADPPPTLTLLEPNGGQVLEAGGPVTVRWSATDADGEVAASLYRKGVYHSSIGRAPVGRGELVGTLCPEAQDGADYEVVVSQGGGWACTGLADASDAPLTVVGGAAAPTFTVTSPRQGDVWANGSRQKVTWDAANLTGIVSLELHRHGRWVGTVGQAPAEAGELDFDLCSRDVGDEHRLSISVGGCGPARPFTSDEFTVLPDPHARPTLTLTSPNGGEVVAGGSQRIISWISTQASGEVQVDLLLGAELAENLGSAPASAGQLAWDVCPYGLESDQYSIRIRLDGGCAGWISDASDRPFALTGLAPAPRMELTAPALGDVIQAGAPTRITWTAANPVGTVGVYLYNEGMPGEHLGEAPMSQEYYDWQVCHWQPPGSAYWIELRPPPCTRMEISSLTTFVVQESDSPTADLDRDCDVDADDVGLFARCATGPAASYGPRESEGCLRWPEGGPYLQADLDRDGDVDQDDFGLLQRSLTGPGRGTSRR